MQKSINGAILRKMILNGAKLLDSNKEHVDSLNVFPVPDGDTGTNMSLTMLSASKEVSNCPSNGLDALSDALRHDFGTCAKPRNNFENACKSACGGHGSGL